MKKSLSHPPKHKREELKEIVSIITSMVEVEMAILFGSYARGNWVEDTYTEGHITYEYKIIFPKRKVLAAKRDGHGGPPIQFHQKQGDRVLDQPHAARFDAVVN